MTGSRGAGARQGASGMAMGRGRLRAVGLSLGMEGDVQNGERRRDVRVCIPGVGVAVCRPGEMSEMGARRRITLVVR